MSFSLPDAARLERRDVLLAFALALAAALVTWHDARLLSRASEAFFHSDDVWFESDMYRRYQSMTSRWTQSPVTHLHPLFGLFTYAPTRIVMVFGVSPLGASWITLAGFAALWIATIFLALRLVGVRAIDAAIFSALAKVTAAGLFWSPTPETYLPGSWTLLLPLMLVAADRGGRLWSGWYVPAATLSIAFSTTNWMSGVFATLVKRPVRHAVRLLALSIAIAAALWGVQKLIVPASPSPLQRVDRGPLFYAPAGGPTVRLPALLVHGAVMPAIATVPRAGDQKLTLSVQRSALGSGSAIGKPLVAMWIVLLGLGIWASWKAGPLDGFRRVLWWLIGAQLAFHLVYGDEMFLYTLHLVPLLVIMIALTSLTRARRVGLGLAALLVAGLWINNRVQLHRAADAVHALLPPPVIDRESTAP